MNEPLDTPKAAPVIGVAPKTMENWRTLGKGPRFIKAGGRVVYDVADLEAWKAAHRVSSTSERKAARLVSPASELVAA